ncbi:hypothetical protein [Streptomyces sp. NPDC058486]|uniref:hypothetical protein n=1 Tax=unclassified Streptomyces TaxID=2593676 RepID=UPI003666B6E2
MGEEPNDARPQDAPPNLHLNKPDPTDEPTDGPADGPADRPADEPTGTIRFRPARGSGESGTGSAASGDGSGTAPTATGSFRLPAPAPADGPAPWEAPPQNSGSPGPAGPADSAGPGFGPPAGGFGPPSAGFGAPAPAPTPAPATAPGWGGVGTIPPPPAAPPGGRPGGGGGQGEARPLQAVLVALLNLSCLGLGYVLLRQWIGAAVCWVATAALLLLALPADADGVPVGVLVGYGVVLLAAAADGARRGLRARLAVGATARRLALPLAVVLLAVPAGGTVAYGAAREEAREEAFQQSLLARLATADELVKSQDGIRFDLAETDYETALDAYEKLALEHPGSRAAKLVPERLDAYFAAVSTPYTDKSYCLAVAPLKHLRALPDTVDEAVLGDRAAALDEPLAQSLYECGAAELGREATEPAHESFTELASVFPESSYIAKVESLVGDGLRKAAAPLSDGTASDPCATTEKVRTKRADATKLKGFSLGGPVADADRGIQKGVFACGTKQFRDGNFSDAERSMDRYAKDYPKSPQTAHARTISIAAQIADYEAAAGKKLPSATVPGGARMPMVVSNDGDGAVELLYTGPVTGRVTLKACGTCDNYGPIREAVEPDAKPCGGPSSKYPKTTLQLPAGTYYFLQRRTGSLSGAGETKDSKAVIQPGYTYTNCLYVTSRF